MAPLERTLIRLREDTMHELRARATREGKTLLGVVREAIDLYLGRDSATGAAPTADVPDPFDSLVGCVDSGMGDGAASHDHYLYGWPKAGRELAPVPRRKRAHRSRRPQ